MEGITNQKVRVFAPKIEKKMENHDHEFDFRAEIVKNY